MRHDFMLPFECFQIINEKFLALVKNDMKGKIFSINI